MTSIIEGMTPAEFLIALNANFEENLGVGTYTTITDEMDGVALQNALNDNFSRSDTYIELSGISYIYLLNRNFSTISPSIVWETDQTALETIIINYFWVINGNTVHISWGDGTGTDITTNNNYSDPNITKDYTTEGIYRIVISGDIDKITYILKSTYTSEVVTGDLSSWDLSPVLRAFHLLGYVWSGDISNWILPDTLQVLHVGASNLTGNLENWNLPEGLYDFHLENNGFTGDITKWDIPSSMAHFSVAGNNFTGNLTYLIMPNSSVYGTVILRLSGNNFTGDISDWVIDNKLIVFHVDYCPFTGNITGLIPAGTAAIVFNASYGTKLTGLPRGNFRWVSEYKFNGNACDITEIDAILAYIDAYFVGGVVPLTNCIYWLSGTGMGIPSAAGLISRQSIIDKYVANGKTCTITVNS